MVLETDDGMVLMDPHAAHERVLFERFMDAIAGGRVDSQGLLMPETVELNPKDAQRVRRHMETLNRIGFGISEFGSDSFVIDALPACLPGVTARQLLTDITAAFEETDNREGGARVLEDRIARAACKAAVKARHSLGLEEIEGLVLALAKARMPYTCPHGRPTIIHTSFHELDSRFGRA